MKLFDVGGTRRINRSFDFQKFNSTIRVKNLSNHRRTEMRLFVFVVRDFDIVRSTKIVVNLKF